MKQYENLVIDLSKRCLLKRSLAYRIWSLLYYFTIAIMIASIYASNSRMVGIHAGRRLSLGINKTLYVLNSVFDSNSLSNIRTEETQMLHLISYH